ncbi:DUF6383 domain-containing protein [uncultured Parabacteroides sp.]|uniref:DUF6383 domain-containing protein n=1 Tax=uncultured Parabacteroides sp. TaxID=512312 RepID=UPI0026DD5239|nr:DUF6383 domain-containing protein [uncultured Parabacteroides sp.]
MKKRIFTLMTAALLMAGPAVNVAYAAAGAITVTAGTVATALEGTKFYLGTGDSKLFPIKTVTGSDFVTIDAAAAASASTAVFEVRNLKTVDETSVSFELWTAGKQLGVKNNGAAFTADDKAEDIFTSFVATYADKKDAGTLNINNIYVNKFGATAISNWGFFTASVEQDAAFLQDYNSKGLTFGFEGKNVIGNAFEETLQVVPVVATAFDEYTPSVAGFVLVKGTADDVKALKTEAAKIYSENGTAALAAAKKVSFLSITDEVYQINGAQAKEAAVIKVLEKGKFVPAAANIENVLFTKVEQADVLNNPAALTLTMGSVVVGGVQPDGKGDNVYVTTVLNNGSSTLTANPAILGTSTYLDASVLLKKDAVNTVNIYFTSGKQSVDGDANQQYEYHKYLVAGAGASDYQLEARAKSEIDLASPMTQWVVSGFNGKASFTLTNREATSPANELVLKLKATDVEGEYEIESATPADDAAIAAGVTTNNTGNAGDKNQSLIGKTVRFNSVATTKTDGFLEMTKAEREGGFHLLFSGKVPGGIAEMYGVLANNNIAAAGYTPSENKEDYAFTAEVAKSTADSEANYIINAVAAAYLDKDGNIVTIKDTLAVPSYKLYAGNATGTTAKLYLVEAATSINSTSEGEFFFRKNNDGTYAMGVAATTGSGAYATDIVATAEAVGVAADGTAFDKNATLYNSKAISNVTIKFNDNSDATSLPAEPRHVSFDNVLGSVAMQMNKNNLEEGILSKEGLTFWLDTVGKADVPKFYISRGVEGQDERLFMFNSADSLGIFSEDDAQLSENKNYLLEGTASDPKAIFRAATLTAKDTLTTTVDGDLIKDDLKAYQYTIQLNDEDVDNEYVVKSVKGGWLYALNGKLGFTSDPKKAMVFTLGDEVPTSNDAIEVSEVKVIAGEGQIQIAGAQGKKVVVSNILGQVIANTVVASDNAAIAAPAGVVVVAVEGEAAVKAIVK